MGASRAGPCKAFAELHDSETLNITYDYEPRPLRQRFGEQFAERCVWSQRRVGDGRWEVAIRKLPASVKRDHLADFMDRCPIFATASPETRSTLARVAVVRSIGRNQSLTGQGVEWPFVGAVLVGRIFAIKETPEGRDQILFEAGPYEVFGDMVMFDGGQTDPDQVCRPFTSRLEFVLFQLVRKTCRRVPPRDPGFAFALAASCAQRARGLIELLCQLARGQRVARPRCSRRSAAARCRSSSAWCRWTRSRYPRCA